MFDPFQIYRREKKDTHKGQIIRKKPVDQVGPISAGQLPLLHKYAEALGYKIVPRSFKVANPRTFLFTSYNGSARWVLDHSSQFTLQDVSHVFDDTLIKNIPDPGYRYSIKHFRIRAVIINFSASSSIEHDVTFTFSSPNITINNYFVHQYTSLYSIYQNATQLYILYTDSNQSSSQVVYSYTQAVDFYQGIDYKEWWWTGSEAAEKYLLFQNNASALLSENFLVFSIGDNSTQTSRYLAFIAYAEVGIEEIV